VPTSTEQVDFAVSYFTISGPPPTDGSKGLVYKQTHMLTSPRQNAGQHANRSSDNLAQFKYLGTTVTNENLIQEEIKSRFNAGNACYQSSEPFVFSSAI
jgi:hypothetical protein